MIISKKQQSDTDINEVSGTEGIPHPQEASQPT